VAIHSVGSGSINGLDHDRLTTGTAPKSGPDALADTYGALEEAAFLIDLAPQPSPRASSNETHLDKLRKLMGILVIERVQYCRGLLIDYAVVVGWPEVHLEGPDQGTDSAGIINTGHRVPVSCESLQKLHKRRQS
jgi:hypothetical protein